ncbi:MAG: right-handed parallel beta-helix repeat-containing protein [Candidatus Bathyarchaeota archaeon]|nr:right-handed parallel beta-helix repeat-containing protein [Candidatus Bathyarchaeota archaeon]
MKIITCLTLIMVILLSLVFVGNVHSDTVQGYEAVNGIITSDTTWTKANSPYNLTGNVAIDKRVTLTIEPGVTVNLNSYFIRVNGTLTARGTSTDNICLNDGYLEFTASSAGWNPQTGTGCIIENAVINSIIRTTQVSLLINNNTITKSLSLAGGSPIVSKNTIAIFSDDPQSRARAISISDTLYLSSKNTALIIDNMISGGFEQATIVIGSGSPIIQRNIISNNYGYGGNLGYGQAGIFIYPNASPIIKQNTITKNANGIVLLEGNSNPTIVYNNIEDNTNYNLYLNLGAQSNIDATNNWWGTTDIIEIDKKIWDYHDDFNLGKVNYTPFLNTPNPQAVPDQNTPTPTLTPTPPPTDSSSTPAPSQEPRQPEPTIIVGVAIVAVVFGAGLGLLIYLAKRK